MTQPPFVLIYDTESTGICSYNKSLTDPSQPHLVQLSALVMSTEDQRVHQSMNFVVQPDNYTIPEETVLIHGISTEYAKQWGMGESAVLSAFLSLWDSGNPEPLTLVAHNAKFDKQMIAISIARVFGEGPILSHWLSHTSSFCIMEAAKPIVQARNKKGAIKFPKLTESYKFFFDSDLSHAHTANADVAATAAIYFALQEYDSAPPNA